jgi:hypothetical protein
MEGKEMKRFVFILSIAIILGFTVHGNATTFSLISNSNSISGWLDVDRWTGTEFVGAYNGHYSETSSAPLYSELSYLDCYAYSGASVTGVFMAFDSFCDELGYDIGFQSVATAYAQSVSIFKPVSIGEITPITFVDTSNWGHTFAWAWIKDLTTNQEIFSMYPDGEPDWEDYSYNFIQRFSYSDWALNHEYQLTMYVWGGDSEMVGDGGMFTDLSFVTVPEPTTILLLGIGIVGLAGVRRKLS